MLCLLVSLLAGCDTLRIERPLLPAPTAGSAGAASEAAAPAAPLERAWRYDAEGGFGPAPMLVAPGRLLVATRHGELHLVEAESGDRLGKRAFGDAVEGAPVLLDGRLLIVPVAGGKYGLIGYDLVRGDRVWARRGDLHAAGLLVVEGTLVAAALDGTVRGLDPRTGEERWALRPDTLARYFAPPVPLVEGRPAMLGRHVAVADDRGRITAVDPATGEVAWTRLLGAPVHEAPAATEGLLVVPTTRGFVAALDTATGEERWRFEAESASVLFASPALVPGSPLARLPYGVVVGASDGVVRALDPLTGVVAWTQRFDGNVAAAPLVVGGTVYVGTLDEKLAALDLITGAVRWSATLPGRIKSAPVLAGGVLVVAAEPRFLYAYRTAGGVAAR